MTIQEAMDRVDEIRPNKQKQTLKVRWLSELDGIIWRELEKTHGPADPPGGRPPWEYEDGSIDPYWNYGKRPPKEDPINWESWRIGQDVAEQIPGPSTTDDEEQDDPQPQPTPSDEFVGYDNITDWETTLKAPFPYDEIYTYWLLVKIDLQTQELDKYANDSQLFNAAWANLSSWWTRTHMPRQGSRHFRL